MLPEDSTSLKMIKVLSSFSMTLSSVPIMGACIFNFFFANSTQQVFYTDIEVLLLSGLMLAFMIIEMARRGREYEEFRAAQRKFLAAGGGMVGSMFKMPSFFPLSGQPKAEEERTLRHQALKSIINHIKGPPGRNEKKLEKLILSRKRNPKSRWSDPYIKKPMYSEEEWEESDDNLSVVTIPMMS